MLWRVNQLDDFMLEATDGYIGVFDSLDIDIRNWKVRDLIVRISEWRPEKVRLDIGAVCEVAGPGILRLRLTRDEVRRAAVVERRVSEQERELHPAIVNSREMVGCALHAEDGAAGRIDDLLLDDADWTLRFLVVDIHPLLPGKRVLLPPGRIVLFDWQQRHIFADVSGQALRHAPAYHASLPLGPAEATAIASYYAAHGRHPGAQPNSVVE